MRLNVDHPRPTFTLQMTEDEAEILCSLIGGVRDLDKVSFLWELFCDLDPELKDRSVSFSDYFEGDVRVRA